MKISHNSFLRVYVESPPHSVDPIDYDAFVHHVAFRSVYSSLITEYKAGGFKGSVAESWSSSDNYTKWNFKIHPNAKFENGDPVTPEIVVKSFKRLAYIMKMKGSKSLFFDRLVGVDKFQDMSDNIAGLTYNHDSVTLQLDAPNKGLLTIISFGQYGIIHPNDYDSSNGQFKNKMQMISNGPYALSEWNDSTIQLKLKDNFYLDTHPKAFQKIEIIWDKGKKNTADLLMGDATETDLSKSYLYHGGPESSIAYARCRPYAIKGNPCNNIEIRRQLRDAFYTEMEVTGQKITRSFFPLAIPGVLAFTENQNDGSHSDVDKSLSTGIIRYAETLLTGHPFISYKKAIPLAIAKIGGRAESIVVPRATFIHEYNQDLKQYSAEIYSLGTGILIEDPMADVHFMFESKEGVRLPDPTGRCSLELKKSNPNIQLINQQLWDDAIIWPITHYSSGVWAKANIDLSQINLLLPPTDFQWIGEK